MILKSLGLLTYLLRFLQASNLIKKLALAKKLRKKRKSLVLLVLQPQESGHAAIYSERQVYLIF